CRRTDQRMTAPPRSRDRTRSTTERSGERGGAARNGNGATGPRTRPGARSAAAERAYARRAQRADQHRSSVAGGSRGVGQGGGRWRPRMPRSRTSFVTLVMVLLATGVVATLWLSTQAIAGSYKLEQLRENNNRLSEQVGQLERTVTKRESPGWLAEHARELGMVPGGTAAKLVVDSDGSVSLVGEPRKVTAPEHGRNRDSSAGSAESSDEGDSGG